MARNLSRLRIAWKALRAFRGTLSRRTELGLGVLAFGLVVGLWVFLVEGAYVKPQYLPSPLEIGRAFHRLFSQFNFIDDIYISVARVAAAFSIAAAMAIPIGIMMSSYRVIGAMSEPVVDLIHYLPVPALVPLTVMWLGIGEVSKVALLWMGTFFQLVLLIADDAKRVPHEYVEISYTLGAKSRHVLRWVILPAMLPNIVDNLRITLGWCWSYVILAEIVAANQGIGHVIWASRRYGKMPEVLAGVLTIGIIGLASDQAIRYLHRRAFKYLR